MLLVDCADTDNLNLANSLQITSLSSARTNQSDIHSGWHFRPQFNRATATTPGLLSQVGQGRTVKQRHHLCFRSPKSHIARRWENTLHMHVSVLVRASWLVGPFGWWWDTALAGPACCLIYKGS